MWAWVFRPRRMWGRAVAGSGRDEGLGVGPLVIVISGGSDFSSVLFCPGDETVEHTCGVATEIGEVVVNTWGDCRVQRARHKPVALERPQRLGEHLLGDAVEVPPQLSEAQGPVAQRTDDEVGPFVGDHLEHGARGAPLEEDVGRGRLVGIHEVPIYQQSAFLRKETKSPHAVSSHRKPAGASTPTRGRHIEPGDIMRAISQQTFGGPEVLGIAEMERPEPLPTEVLVCVRAVGVNPVDTSVRSGAWPLLGNPPFVLGWDVSGVVEDIGAGVTRFAPGDEVYGMPYFPRAVGAYAEFVVASSRQLAYKPAGLDHPHSAALPLAGLTAWQGLVDAAQVGEGEHVLIHGGGGGVGHLAVQIAKARGAHVTATVSRSKHAFVRGLGADQLVDYRAVDFVSHVADVDVVLDLVGGGYGERSLPTLRTGGVLVTAADPMNRPLADKAEAVGVRFAGIMVEPDHVALEALADLVDDGLLRVHLDRTFAFDDIAGAHRYVEDGHMTGKGRPHPMRLANQDPTRLEAETVDPDPLQKSPATSRIEQAGRVS
jgi:NADPH:quinone reductase-like Zn-dependent oxidoreductase